MYGVLFGASIIAQRVYSNLVGVLVLIKLCTAEEVKGQVQTCS